MKHVMPNSLKMLGVSSIYKLYGKLQMNEINKIRLRDKARPTENKTAGRTSIINVIKRLIRSKPLKYGLNHSRTAHKPTVTILAA